MTALSSFAAIMLTAGSLTVTTPVPGAPITQVEVLSTSGTGCVEPQIRFSGGGLGEQGTLTIFANTKADAWGIDLPPSTEPASASKECVFRLRVHQAAGVAFRTYNYVMEGSRSGPAGVEKTHWLQGSFDNGVIWGGQRSTDTSGAEGPFYQGGGGVLNPSTSPCSPTVDWTVRVGVSLASTTPTSTGSSLWVKYPEGSWLTMVPGACTPESSRR